MIILSSCAFYFDESIPLSSSLCCHLIFLCATSHSVCRRHQVYRVVPYHEAQSLVECGINYFVSGIITKQEMDVIAGLILGICISFFLLWLDRIWHSKLKRWMKKRLNGKSVLLITGKDTEEISKLSILCLSYSITVKRFSAWCHSKLIFSFMKNKDHIFYYKNRKVWTWPKP